MTFGQHSLGVRPDLVRHFAGAAERAIAADDHEINLSALHQMAGGIVGDDYQLPALGAATQQGAQKFDETVAVKRFAKQRVHLSAL